VKRVLARDNDEVDDGWLCDRGRDGFEMFDAEERVTEPRLRGGARAEWGEAIAAAARGLGAAGGEAAAIVGDASNEEGFVVQRIVREGLGSPNVDSRPSRGASREQLVRLAAPEISVRTRDIDDADAILVLGTDPMHSMSILDLRIRKAIRRNGARLAVATERPTALDGGAVEAVRYAPGGAASFLSQLAEALRADAAATDTPSSLAFGAKRSEGVSASAAVAAAVANADKIVVVWGERISREQGADEALLEVADALGLAGKDGSGLLEVPDFANGRGLREVGCLPDAGPGFAETASGRGTEEIRAALESGEITSLLLVGVDPVRDFPDTRAWEAALGAADFVVAFSTFENDTTAKADVVFPLETHAEKDGTVTHPDGRLQRLRPSAGRPGDIRPGWWALAEIADALGVDTGITSQPSALAAISAAVPFYAGIDNSEIAGRGVRWQDRDAASAFPAPATTGAAGAADVGMPSERFAHSADSAPGDSGTTSDRRAASEEGMPTAADSLRLGTYRDLWVGPITELNPPLKFLRPRQELEVAPADAEKLKLRSGEAVRVSQNGSSVEATVRVKERVQPGVCFLGESIEGSNANALLNGGPVSVTIEKLEAATR
jgi:NADH-quinone oxidoreductase subunit G